jgi:Spy/CpxP family protein refolding chaperone
MTEKKMIGLASLVLMLAFIYSTMNAQAVRPPRAGRSGAFPRVLKDALQLTPEQEKKLEEFRQARRNETKAYQEKMAPMRDELRKLMGDPKADDQKINNLIDQMAKLRADRMKALYQSKKAWEKIFTPEQLKKLQEYRQDFKLRREARQGRMGRKGRMMMRPGLSRPETY